MTKKRFIILITVLITLAFANVAHAEFILGQVEAPVLNVRSGPGLNYSIIGVLYVGDYILFKSDNISGDWFNVLKDLDSPYTGWVHSDYIYIVEP